MMKVYTFNQSLMNGTVTMKSSVACFGSRELAEKARKAVMEADGDDAGGLRCCCDEIVETDVYESEDEVPILNS